MIPTRESELHEMFPVWFPADDEDPSDAPRAYSPPNGHAADDRAVLDKLFSFRNGQKSRRLFDGDWQTLGYLSQSEADAALCGMFAFMVGPNESRIDSLFRQSALYREKWERDDYRASTFRIALKGRTEFYDWDRVSRKTTQTQSGADERPDAHQARPQKPILRFTARAMQEAFPKLDPPVIQGWLRMREILNIISVAKVGKSWLVYYILLCVVTGRMIFDRWATTPGRGLLIDNELPPSLLPFRIKTVADAMGLHPDEYLDKLDIWSLRHSPRSIYQLTGEFAGIPPETYILAILDAKYKSLGEDADENSNADEARYFAEAGALTELIGSALGLVHHSTKGSQSEKRVVDVGAGGSSQARAADTHLVIREHEDEGAFVLAAAVRSFAPVEPLGLRWQFPLWVPDDTLDPEQLKGRKSAAEEGKDRRDREAEEKVIEACQTWQSRLEIKRATGLGADRRDAAIARLLSAKPALLSTEKQDRPRNPGTEVFRKTIYAK